MGTTSSLHPFLSFSFRIFLFLHFADKCLEWEVHLEIISDMLQEQEGTPNQLPEDVLVNILGRLAPRCLATSRCVCKPWCTIIDTRRLLRSDLLPLSLAGIFINFHDLVLSEFFSCFSVTSTLSDYLLIRDNFGDHCNGLLMLSDYSLRSKL